MHALIIGLGSVGIRHLKNLHSFGIKQLSALRQRNLTSLENIPEGVNYFSDLKGALKQKPDIVVIANPTSMHLSYAKQALKAGCHIYLEKPVSHNIQGVDQLVKLQKETNRVVQVGCQLRCHPHLINIKNWVDSGKLGAVHSVVADVGEYLPDWHPWEDYRTSYSARKDQGGGVILTLIHEIDYLYWIFGSMTIKHSMGGNLTPLSIDVDDTALIAIKANNGIPIHLRMDYWRRPPVRTLNIVGDKGEVFWDYHKGELLLYSKGERVDENILSEDWNRNELFLDLMKNFLDAVNGKRFVCSPLSDGFEVLKLAVAAKDRINLLGIK